MLAAPPANSSGGDVTLKPGRHPVFMRQWTVLVDAPLGKGHYWLCPLVWQMGSKPGLCQLRSTRSTQAQPCQRACHKPPLSSSVRGWMRTGGSCHENGWRQLDFMYWIASLCQRGILCFMVCIGSEVNEAFQTAKDKNWLRWTFFMSCLTCREHVLGLSGDILDFLC